jgi:hypothetical protein
MKVGRGYTVCKTKILSGGILYLGRIFSKLSLISRTLDLIAVSKNGKSFLIAT